MRKVAKSEVPTHVCAAIEDYQRRLIEAFGPRLRKVALFGSWARGEQHAESDIDVLVLVDGADRKDWRLAVWLSADAALATETRLSATVYSTEQMRQLTEMENPFARGIAREAIALYEPGQPESEHRV
ncbi:MAG: nucleotidyltransferase domain-containing protein [Myxococcales bacterium]|nr:nucleotidyltransferase domain-containing protein [Myxococcales bacterium]